MNKRILSAVLAAGVMLSSFSMAASAASVKPSKDPIVHYNFEQVEGEIVKNIAAAPDAETSYDGEIINEAVVNTTEGYITLNGEPRSQAVVLPKEAFTQMEKDTFSITFYLKSSTGHDVNRTILSAGNPTGNEGNYYSMRLYNDPEGGFGKCIRHCAKVDGGESQDYYVEFSEKPEAEVKKDVWTLVTLTQTGKHAKIYVNDTMVCEKTDLEYNLVTRQYAGSHRITIGEDGPLNSSGFAGAISDVRVYNYALSDNEVAGVIDDINGNFNVKSVSLDKSQITLTEGAKAKLTATISPATATEKNVTWTSASPSVATVDANGVITAIKAGSSIITVKTVDGDFLASCKISVAKKVIPVSGISLKKSTTITVGSTFKTSVSVSPSNATDKRVTYKSSNGNVASVGKDGRITGKKAGKATITAQAGIKSTSIKITVAPKKVTGLKLKAGKGKATVTFKAVKGATKYQLVIDGKKDYRYNVSKSGKSVKLKKGKYKVKIRAYAGGVYSSYSSNVSVKVK